MLNPSWNKLPYEKDLALWQTLVVKIEGYYKYRPGTFFTDYEREIDRLYNNYYRTNAGSTPNPSRPIRQKFQILQQDKTFDRLGQAVQADFEAQDAEWNENQLRDESLDARLEREKGLFESEGALRSPIFRISTRSTPNKDKVFNFIKKKYPTGIHKEILDEISSGSNGWENVPEIADEDLYHYIDPLKRLNLKSNTPQKVSIEDILDNPENSVLNNRLQAIKNKTINTSGDMDENKNIRSPALVEKYKSMDPDTSPPIAVSNGTKLEWGNHRLLASILRGDKYIMAWVFE